MPYSKEMLIEIYKSQQERFRDSRSHQWKINITFWTLLVLAISYKQFNFGNFWMITLCAVLLSLHLAYIVIIQRNLQTEKKVWCDIIDFLNNPEVNIEKPMMHKIDTTSVETYKIIRRGWFWIFFQIMITIILIGIFLATHWK